MGSFGQLAARSRSIEPPVPCHPARPEKSRLFSAFFIIRLHHFEPGYGGIDRATEFTPKAFSGGTFPRRQDIDAFSIETSGNRRKSGNHRYLPASLYFRQADYAPKPVGIYLTTPLQNFHRRQEIHRAVREYFSTEEEVQILLKNIRKTPQGYEWKVNAKAIRENLSSLLDWNIPDIRSPYQAEILFIKAEHSDYLPEKITEATRYYFPKAPAKTIPEATHRIHVDQPLRLAHMLSDYFLAP